MDSVYEEVTDQDELEELSAYRLKFISGAGSFSSEVQHTADYSLIRGIELHPVTLILTDHISLHKLFQNNPKLYHNSSLRDTALPVR